MTGWLIAKIVLLAFLAFIALLLVGARIVDIKVQFRQTDTEIARFFTTHHLEGKIRYEHVNGRTLRYISVGADSLPVLFFLHGSPSSLSIYNRLLTDASLRNKFRMVAIDRPGYGGSGFGKPEPSIEKQAAELWPILRSLKSDTLSSPRGDRRVIVVAGSYGTSVACRLLMDHPDAADAAVLIAPSLGPGLEKTFDFTHFIEHRWINWAVPRLFRSANTEKLAHRAQLGAMLPYWKNIHVPVFYLQGSLDRLVYPSNAAFAREHLTRCPYLHIEFLPGRPHFFIFSDQPAIVRTILSADLRTARSR